MLLLFAQGAAPVTPPTDNSYAALKRTPLPIQLGGSFRGYRAIPVVINYATAGQAMLISQPASGQCVYLVGLLGSNAAASKITFKSNATEILRLERAANSGELDGFTPSDPSILCNSDPGEALNITCDVALAPMTAYLIEM